MDDGDPSPFGAVGGSGGSAPSSAFGTGNINSVFDAAVDHWENTITTDRTLTIYYGWQNRGPTELGSTLARTASGGNYPQDAYIRFSNSRTDWYFDGDPTDHAEFQAYQEFQEDLRGGVVNTGREYSSPISGLGGTVDFYTVALHEIGHALGFLSSMPGYADPIVVQSPLPYDGSMINTTVVGGGHLDGMDFPHALLNPYASRAIRWLPSDLDILALAQITGDTVAVQEVSPIPEPSSFVLFASLGGLFAGAFRCRRTSAIALTS